ncbi:Helicase associated domain protein [Streptomyces sp. NPDC127074]|uniref:helicase associated domain-containing protein n=1 Tax=Streptomyces sp. NPDC127074 TaxID=3347130 RepID=UPI0036528493
MRVSTTSGTGTWPSPRKTPRRVTRWARGWPTYAHATPACPPAKSPPSRRCTRGGTRHGAPCGSAPGTRQAIMARPTARSSRPVASPPPATASANGCTCSAPATPPSTPNSNASSPRSASTPPRQPPPGPRRNMRAGAEEALAHARSYTAEHGHLAQVSVTTVHHGYPLGRWLAGQRSQQQRKVLSPERQQALNAIDPWWCPPWSLRWQRNYHRARDAAASRFPPGRERL